MSITPTRKPIPPRASVSRPSNPQPSGTLADLTACVRATRGLIPPPLVGASITVLGTGLYVFGGRLVPTRLMISDLYRLDLQSLVWEKIWSPSTNLTSPVSISNSKGKGRASESDSTPNSDTQASTDETDETTDNLHTSDRGPRPRYFHSAEAWDHKLVIFGGMGYANTIVNDKQAQPNQDSTPDGEVGLCVLDDVIIFDTINQTWSFPSTSAAPNVPLPSPRYAHLSCLTCERGYSGPVQEEDYLQFPTTSKTSSPKPRILRPNKRRQRNLLTLIGGQDIANRYIGEINILDLDSMQWIEGRRWERHCGTYRSVACTSRLSVRQGDRFDGTEDADPDEEVLRRLSWSEKPAVERPEPVYLYSNFNFTDVRRDLELISYPTTPPPPPATPTTTGHYTTIHPLSHSMTGVLPAGLRFPTGTMIGTHLIISGTSLNPDKLPDQIDCFAIWALDLSQSNHKHIPVKVPQGTRPEVSTHNNTQFGSGKVVWQRIDPGRIMMSGSWNRAVGWGNVLVVLGDKDRDIVKDYHHRQINFVDVAFIDLEAFAIYQPPFSSQSHVRHGLGRDASLKAARLNLKFLRNIHLTDFEITCADGYVIPVNKKMLEDRWPWFKREMDSFKLKATQAYVTYQIQMRNVFISKLRSQIELDKANLHHLSAGRPGTPNGMTKVINRSRASSCIPPPNNHLAKPNNSRQRRLSFSSTNSSNTTTTSNNLTQLIPKLSLPEPHQVTPRTLHLPHPGVLVQAVLEYIYTRDLVTTLHHSPAILASMLVFATTHDLEHLRMLSVHGLHQFLNPTNVANPNGPRGPLHQSNHGNVAGLIYEAATLSGCMALQIRSLKAIIATQNKHHSSQPRSQTTTSSGASIISNSNSTSAAALTTTNSGRTNSVATSSGASVIFDHNQTFPIRNPNNFDPPPPNGGSGGIRGSGGILVEQQILPPSQ